MYQNYAQVAIIQLNLSRFMSLTSHQLQSNYHLPTSAVPNMIITRTVTSYKTSLDEMPKCDC